MRTFVIPFFYGSGSRTRTGSVINYDSGSGSVLQKVTVPTVPVTVPQHCWYLYLVTMRCVLEEQERPVHIVPDNSWLRGSVHAAPVPRVQPGSRLPHATPPHRPPLPPPLRASCERSRSHPSRRQKVMGNLRICFKGTVPRHFQLQVFLFMNQSPPPPPSRPWVSH